MAEKAGWEKYRHEKMERKQDKSVGCVLTVLFWLRPAPYHHSFSYLLTEVVIG